jgi:hypothetical protein
MENIPEAIKEFNSFKFGEEAIFTKSKWAGDWDSENAVLLICAEYCCKNSKEERECHINYDCKHCGSQRFNEWLSKYNFSFEWDDCCVGYIYLKR